MKKLSVQLIIIYCSFYSLISIAGTNVQFPIPALSYTGPADDISVGVSIGQNWGSYVSQRRICDTTKTSNLISRANIVAISTATNLTTMIDGIRYPVYETGTEGIGWVMGIKDTNATNFSPLNVKPNQWYPAPGTGTGVVTTIGGELKITLVKMSQHLKSGQTNLHGNNIAKISCISAAGKEVDSGYISLNSAPITIAASGCKVMGSTNTSVSLGEFRVKQFTALNSTQGSAVAKTSLSCDNNVHVAVTISDQIDQSNRSNTLKLTPDSTANGIGVQALYKGKLISLGPDDSSKGSQNQFALIKTTSANQIVPFELSFRYIRTGEMKAGSANALVGITFSYQ